MADESISKSRHNETTGARTVPTAVVLPFVNNKFKGSFQGATQVSSSAVHYFDCGVGCPHELDLGIVDIEPKRDLWIIRGDFVDDVPQVRNNQRHGKYVSSNNAPSGGGRLGDPRPVPEVAGPPVGRESSPQEWDRERKTAGGLKHDIKIHRVEQFFDVDEHGHRENSGRRRRRRRAGPDLPAGAGWQRSPHRFLLPGESASTTQARVDDLGPD